MINENNSFISHTNANKKDIQLSHLSKLPKHIAIIMDGNGRWAKKKKLKRQDGYEQGIDPVKISILECLKLGISYLSVFVFSTENWKRPKHEVSFIMRLLSKRLKANYAFYKKYDVRILHSGSREKMSKSALNEIDKVMHETKHNKSITLTMACNYGGKDEIIRAIKRYAIQGNIINDINEHEFEKYFDVPELPDIDILIRTGGYTRLSNFFLWKLAYAELYFTDTLWPDWSVHDFHDAISFYQNTKRKFGNVKEIT